MEWQTDVVALMPGRSHLHGDFRVCKQFSLRVLGRRVKA